MGLGAKGGLPNTVGGAENMAQAGGVYLGFIQGSLSGRGGEQAVPRNLPFPVPCPPPSLLTQPPACLSLSPTAATFHAHLASMETTALFPVNAQKDPATLSLGFASWVRWKAVTRERLALYMSSRSLSLASKAEPTSETFPMPEVCMDALGPPEGVTEPLPPEKPD